MNRFRRNNWYVITGGPSSGKTTLIKILEQLGHNIVHEAARAVIDEGLDKGLTAAQIRADEKEFQDKVLRRKILLEKTHNTKSLTFFDRGMHDTIAYLRFYGWEIEEWVKQAMERVQYRKVFLLEPLAAFTQDEARTEDQEFAQKLHGILYAVYKEAGHSPIRVPVMEPNERAQFILRHIETPAAVTSSQ